MILVFLTELGSANSEQTVTAVATANQTFTLADHGFRTGDKFTATANAAFGSATTYFAIQIDE